MKAIWSSMPDRATATVTVENTGDRPVQVGSHFHFFETNRALRFDRPTAYGMRLDILSRTAVRSEPGEAQIVSLTSYGGQRIVIGQNDVTNGPTDTGPSKELHDDHAHPRLPRYLRGCGGLRCPTASAAGATPNCTVPPPGDRVRLADTELLAKVTDDATVYGDEAVFGGGKTMREGMAVHGDLTNADGALDFVITNALIIDAVLGIRKADIGIRDGRIAGIGKAGNPRTMDGVDPELVIGAGTDIRSGEGMIATAGAIDVHVHFDSAGLVEEAISSGITDDDRWRIGPGHGGHHFIRPNNLARMLRAAEAFPMNFGFIGNGSASSTAPLIEQGRAGAIGYKIHEDWGATPAAIRLPGCR